MGNEFQLDTHNDNLTNLRFADDILILARNQNELHFMLESLMQELEMTGLELNTKKT